MPEKIENCKNIFTISDNKKMNAPNLTNKYFFSRTFLTMDKRKTSAPPEKNVGEIPKGETEPDKAAPGILEI
jgi:hypothetical protein